MFTSGKLSRAFATLIVGALASVIVFFGLIAHGDVNPPIFLTRLGNVIKTYPYTAQLLVGGAFTQGGTVHSTSTSGAVIPLVAANFDEETQIDVTLNVQDATLSFPSTSTLASNFLPTAGMKRDLCVRNATTTAAMDILVSGGTGFLLKKHATSTGTTIYGDTDGGNFGCLTLTRKANTDIEVLLTTYTD